MPAAPPPALPRTTRRQALLAAGSGLAALALARVPRAIGAPRGRVDVVGAGLAGLACAARLASAGVDVHVWEARTRLGGRVLTDLDLVEDAWIECGGEFVDAEHAVMRRLCRTYGIGLQDLERIDLPGTSRDLLGARVYAGDWSEAQDARLAGRAARDLMSMGAERLDRMSAATWLARAIPGWPRTPFARYRAALARGEYGVEPGALSALWLVADLADGARAAAMQDGAERYRIEGGTVRLVDALATTIGRERLTRGTRLLAVRRDAGGATLLLDGPGGTRTQRADRVVITLPPPVLARVDMRASGVPRATLAAIEAMGMGTNAKVIIPFSGPAWQQRGWNAEGTSDSALGATWQATMGQRVRGAALTTLVGGRAGRVIAGPDHGPAPAAVVSARLAAVARVAPGAQAAALPGAVVHAWAHDPYALGSYAAARPGQDDSSPDLTRPYGPVHFAGEHSDDTYGGFMEGAVRSGERAARQVLAAL